MALYNENVCSELFKCGEELKKIALQLAHIIVNLELLNPIGCYDNNIFAEKFFAELFSLIYDSKYKNKNFSEMNFPVIDLINEQEKIAIQITSNDNKAKIDKTKTMFKDKKYPEKGYKLQMLFLKRKLSNTKQKNNKDIKIKYIEDLIKEIMQFDNEKLVKISTFIEKNINFASPDPFVDLAKLNNPYIPKNIDKFLEIETGSEDKLDSEEKEYYINKIKEYINKLQKVDIITLKYYCDFAEKMYSLQENKDFVTRNTFGKVKNPRAITLLALEASFSFSDSNSLRKIIKTMEGYDLVMLGANYNNEEDITFTDISDCQYDPILCDIAYKITDFAHKINVSSYNFFVNLDFSPMEN